VTYRPVVAGLPGTDDVVRARQRGKLAATGDVVVVEMRLDDVADADVRGSGGVEVDVDVATRVDDRRQAGRLVGDERREVAEAIDAAGSTIWPSTKVIGAASWKFLKSS
jgi:hypothetical protein